MTLALRSTIFEEKRSATRVCLAAAVMMAMALGHVRAGRIEQMRSLVRPVSLAA